MLGFLHHFCFINYFQHLFVCIIAYYLFCLKVSEAISLDRDIVENGLTFAGFVVIN